MAKPAEKMKAFALRREGLGIKEIAREVGVAPGTISKWLIDLPLTEPQRKLIHERHLAAGNRGRMMGARMNTDKKLERIDVARTQAAKTISEVSPDALFFMGLGLYWGEGTKTSSSSLAVSNSDPRVIILMIRWFIECFDIKKEQFMPRIFISEVHRDRETVITAYWSKTLNIPHAQFKRMVFLPRGKKIYENRDIYYGVLALRVSKGGEIRTKILAYIERVSEVSGYPMSA